MIRNQREYKISKAALVSYEDALATFDVLKYIKSGVDAVIANAQRSSYERQIDELREQLEAYEALRDGETTEFSLSSVADLGRKLISARIAKGLTQRELAALAGLKEQQIQKYEKEEYETANLRRLAYIAGVLDVSFSGEVKVRPGTEYPESEFLNTLNPSQFPLSAMNGKGWFGRQLDLRRSSVAEKKRALCAFFSQAGLTAPPSGLHRKTQGELTPDRKCALMAWQARVTWKAKTQVGLARRFAPLPPAAVKELVQLSRDPEGPLKAIEFLLEYGVIVVFERHLPKTKLDGAAMVLDGRYAVIGMTLRHDRIDNFWFVLLHELGHIMRHWGPLLRDGFLDEEGDDQSELAEREANEFAQNAVVPSESWQASFVRFTKSPEEVTEFADKVGVHAALIAGRLRNDRSSYSEFVDLIGNGEVRSLFEQRGLLEHTK